MIAHAACRQISACVSSLAILTAQSYAQNVIDTLNQPSQTIANGETLTVKGNGSVVSSSFRAVFGRAATR